MTSSTIIFIGVCLASVAIGYVAGLLVDRTHPRLAFATTGIATIVAAVAIAEVVRWVG
jgi:hypothetical protein